MKQWQLFLLRIALGVASGALLGVAFRSEFLGLIIWIAAVPLIVMATHPVLREGNLLWAGISGWVVFYCLALTWFFGFNLQMAAALMVGLAPFLVPIPHLLKRCVRHWSIPLVLLVPIVWAGWEVVRHLFTPPQYRGVLLGHTQFVFPPLAQLADLFGVAGVSFVIAMANGAIVDLLYAFTPLGGAGRPSRRRALLGVGAFAVVFVAAIVYGVFRMSAATFQPGPKLALVQPAVRHAIHHKGQTRSASKFQAKLSIENVPPGTADMIVWPENSITAVLDSDPAFMEDINAVLAITKTDLLMSAFRWVPDNPENPMGRRYSYTSVFQFRPDGEQAHVYDKVFLIPLTEYLPFELAMMRLGPAFHRFYFWVVDHLVGWRTTSIPSDQGVTVFTLENPNGRWTFGAPTCYENTNPALPREAVNNGAEFLINMTSEGTLGPLASHQLFIISAFRAIENRVSVARCGNIGITGFIYPNGMPQRLFRGHDGAMLYRMGVLVDHVVLDSRTGTTLYSRLGEWPAHMLTLITLILVVAPWFRRRGGGDAGNAAAEATREP